MSTRRYRLVSSLRAFFITALPLALLLGIVRTWVRYRAGILPDQYLVHAAVVNALLYLLFALAALPVVAGAAVSGLARKRPLWPLFGGFVFSFLLFWGFNTKMGFRVLREFSAGETGPVFAELSTWLPGMIAFVVVGTVLGTGAEWRSTLRRSAVAGLVALLLIAGLRLHAHRLSLDAGKLLDIKATARSEPHVFLILVDTLRADHLGVYGYPKPTSPNVDRLAAESTVYERAFAPSPWTRPSCGALLTSRYPPEIGLDSIFKPLPAEIPILPQYLATEGYQTAGIVSSVHLSAQFGFDKGWDLLDIGTSYLRWTGVQTASKRLGLIPWGEFYPRYDARELTDQAIEWLDGSLEHGSNAPVFMYLHYSDPHAPYRPPAEHDRWREFARPEVVEKIAEPPFSPTWGNRPLADLEVEALVARYNAEIAYLDQELARFLEYLRDRGIFESSLIFLTADHGEEFADHGGWSHSHTLYNELVHVPMIVKYPDRLRLEKGRRIAATASLVDVVPTIRDVLGARWPQSLFRGRSLLRPELETDDYTVYARADGHGLRAVVSGDDKLIQSVDGSGTVSAERYFSLAEDFAERGDGSLPADLEPERVQQLRTVARGIDSLAFGSDGQEVELDAATLEELRALGYID